MSDAPDEYELRYMDGARAIARVRQRQARWFVAALMAAVALLVASLVPMLWHLAQSPGGRAVALLYSAVFALELLALVPAMILGHITRAVVTPSHLRVHVGLLTSDVPLGAITALAVEPVRRWRPPGSTLGRLLGRERVFVNLDAEQCLRVDWRDERGRGRTLWAQLDAAPELCALLASLTAGRTGVRVEAGADDADGEMVAADAESATAARAKAR
jgi:hypothetical protein